MVVDEAVQRSSTHPQLPGGAGFIAAGLLQGLLYGAGIQLFAGTPPARWSVELFELNGQVVCGDHLVVALND